MRTTCKYVERMSKMIQLRNVPDSLHRRLKARAAMEGMSLSEYLIGEVRRAADRPTVSELRERLARRAAVKPRVPVAAAVREEREGR
jgi:plasmid stability protein